MTIDTRRAMNEAIAHSREVAMTKSTMSIAGLNQRPTRLDNQQAGPVQAVEARLEVHEERRGRGPDAGPPSMQTRVAASTPVSHSPMASDRPPLVLFHPWLLTGSVWQEVIPLVSGHHQVFAPTALGHRGGPPVQSRPVSIWDVVDDAERYLDEQGLQKPHLAGNSMGGFVALELARRGRAATVCLFSPAGFSATGDGTREPAGKRGRRIATLCRLTGPAGPLVFKSPFTRRLSLRVLNAARHGDRLPQATFTILPDVGHVPMIDDPGLVARTILAATGAGMPQR